MGSVKVHGTTKVCEVEPAGVALARTLERIAARRLAGVFW